jgi:ABC-2 type transport system ATP-binding protein
MTESDAIRTVGLTHAYGSLRAVDALDLSVARGTLFALLGPNGAGKSTTIRILTTLQKPTSGQAFVAGFDVAHDARRARRASGVVFQDVSLDDRLTARENLMLHAEIFGVPRAERAPRVRNRLEWIGLAQAADQRVRTLSGGMKRRLEIARALVHDPEVIILDEPTVGLDAQTRRAVWDHLAKVASSRDRTVFVTTHYMDEAERCEDVAILDHGKLIARGTPRELLAHAGAERLLVASEDDERTCAAAKELGYVARLEDGRVSVEGEKPEIALAKLAERGLGLRAIDIVRPRLEDAFVALTGHAIRDDADEGGGGRAAMRTQLRARGRT